MREGGSGMLIGMGTAALGEPLFSARPRGGGDAAGFDAANSLAPEGAASLVSLANGALPIAEIGVVERLFWTVAQLEPGLQQAVGQF